MPFTVIKGRFPVIGKSPDGDSIRFAPDNPVLIRKLPGPRDKKAVTEWQLRLEAIDALETHYAGRSQPDQWAFEATERLLGFVGITNTLWDARRKTVVSADDNTRGWILSREREKNRRPVAFLFAGDTDEEDGAEVRLTPKMMRKSFNFAALAEGLAYPTYYQGLFADLRAELTKAVREARSKSCGLWPDDATNAGFDATSLSVLIDDTPIMPKLFRRLSDYMAAKGTAIGFRDALSQSREGVLHLPTQNFTHFDTFIEQAPGSTRIRMTVPPEELVFDPMPAQPTNKFAAMVGAPISGEAMAV